MHRFLDMHRFTWFVLLSTACGPQVIAREDDGTTGEPPAGSTSDAGVPGNPVTSAATTNATTGHDDASTEPDATFGAADESTDEGGLFLVHTDGTVCGAALPPDTLAHCSGCDLWVQDCPDGEKCMPWSNVGGPHWNATRCSPVEPAPAQLGEPCTVRGKEASGLDDCDVGLMCFFVDPDTHEGTCVALCQGSSAAPQCAAGGTCALDYDGAITLCLPPCDPLVDDCELGTCIPVQDDFVCFADGTARLPGESCERPADCAAGSTCIGSDVAGSCGLDAAQCCVSFCDLGAPDPSAPCLPDQGCTPWYRPGAARPPLDAVGVCTQPPR